MVVLVLVLRGLSIVAVPFYWRRKWQPTPVFLPREFPWTGEPGRLQSMGSQRVGHDQATKHSIMRLSHVTIRANTWCVSESLPGNSRFAIIIKNLNRSFFVSYP